MAEAVASKTVLIRITEEQLLRARACAKLLGNPIATLARLALIEKMDAIEEAQLKRSQMRKKRALVPDQDQDGHIPRGPRKTAPPHVPTAVSGDLDE